MANTIEGNSGFSQDLSNPYKVKLVSTVDPMLRVVFNVSPKLGESRKVDYTQVQPVGMPGSLQVYKSTDSRTFNLTVPLISRSTSDATLNAFNLQMLRSWTMPYFGLNSVTDPNTIRMRRDASGNRSQIYRTTQQPGAISAGNNGGTMQPTQGSETPEQVAARQIEQVRSTAYELLGAPPEILYLTAYSAGSNNRRYGDSSYSMVFNLSRIPVVITGLEISYPDDVDYILTAWDREPMPTKWK